MMISMGRMSAILALGCLAFLVLFATPARAQHSDWLLGTDGLLSGQQAPRGIYYSNIWSYYHASGNNFAETGPLKCGPRDRVCLSLNLGGNGSLDLFVDQNVFVWTSPYKILGATYGLLVDVPFGIADASGAGSVETVPGLYWGLVCVATGHDCGASHQGQHLQHVCAADKSGLALAPAGRDRVFRIHGTCRSLQLHCEAQYGLRPLD